MLIAVGTHAPRAVSGDVRWLQQMGQMTCVIAITPSTPCHIRFFHGEL